MARATTSFPVPVSPRIKTGNRDFPMRVTSRCTWRIAGELPTSVERGEKSSAICGVTGKIRPTACLVSGAQRHLRGKESLVNIVRMPKRKSPYRIDRYCGGAGAPVGGGLVVGAGDGGGGGG